MPIYAYECGKDGVHEEFSRTMGPRPEAACPECGGPARPVISAPAMIDVKRGWNEKANLWQRDPYTQSKAQLTNMNRAAAERGEPLVKITEGAIQAGARAIHEQRVNPKPDPENRQIAQMRRETRRARREKADRAAGKIE